MLTFVPDAFDLPISQLHRPGQATSAKALAKAPVTRINRTRAVYEVLKTYGERGGIPEELAIGMGEDLIDVRRCFSVLKKLNRIAPTGEERQNGKKNWCEVFRAITIS